uniref:Mediator of RNA polymerase II transcription subunit 13 n=1 Tax=Caenorhabditis japonica TaxID=281687 RepID=A0A8R1EJ77_CAEJA
MTSFVCGPQMNVPEGDSLTIAILLSDTILDLHYDSVFDSCPICSCSVSIRSRELGMYITPHEVLRQRTVGHSNMREHTMGTWSGFHVNSTTNCTCGFSAIRHRYLSCSTGLFPEDANEATTLDNAVANVIPPLDYKRRNAARDMIWFDSKSVHDLALLDQIRQMAFSLTLGKAISQMATVKEHKVNLATAMDIEMDINVPSEYIISHVDSLELLMLGNSAIEMSMKMSSINRNQTVSAQKFLTYFHPWGLQTANEIEELETTEWFDLLSMITPTLDGAMKQARKVSVADAQLSIEGPLTWKQLVMKSIRGRPTTDDDEDFSLAEPIPAVMRATDKEAIRTAPHIDQYYDQASLGPIDQPKDVMYLTIIPDDDVIYEKTVKFMEELTEKYEKMHLGRHIPFPVSTGTATRFRKILDKYHEEHKEEASFPEYEQHAATFASAQVRRQERELASQPPPIDERPERWSAHLTWKLNHEDGIVKGPEADFDMEYEGDHDKWEKPMDFRSNYMWRHKNAPRPNPPHFYEREGVLRVGNPNGSARIIAKHTVALTNEFNNMTKHLSDSKGFVSRLKLYVQQMEDLATYALTETPDAFERTGYRYQMAVEGRLKRAEGRRKKTEERLRYGAAKVMDEWNNEHGAKKPEESDLMFGATVGNIGPKDYVDDEAEEKKRRKQKEEEQYPPEGPQAPSPVPAGMVHIPETRKFWIKGGFNLLQYCVLDGTLEHTI